MRKAFALWLLAVIAILATVWPASASGPQAAVRVAIYQFSYRPSQVTIHVNDYVGWKNFDQDQHTVTANDYSWNSRTMNRGQIYYRQFPVAGTYNYHCDIHPFMTGTITVQ